MAEQTFPGLVDRARRALRGADHLEAASLFHQAALAAHQEGLPSERAYALRHCAIAEIENGNFKKALGDASEALEFYRSEEGQGSLNVANSLRLIALAQEGLEERSNASSSWGEARRIYEECGITEGLEECDAHLSRLSTP